MNKKDCDTIGFILSDSASIDEINRRLFELDGRIESEFTLYEEVYGRSKDVDFLAEKLMNEAHKDTHHHWSLLKKKDLNRAYESCLDEARKEIYGNDYSPSLFKQTNKRRHSCG